MVTLQLGSCQELPLLSGGDSLLKSTVAALQNQDGGWQLFELQTDLNFYKNTVKIFHVVLLLEGQAEADIWPHALSQDKALTIAHGWTRPVGSTNNFPSKTQQSEILQTSTNQIHLPGYRWKDIVTSTTKTIIGMLHAWMKIIGWFCHASRLVMLKGTKTPNFDCWCILFCPMLP